MRSAIHDFLLEEREKFLISVTNLKGRIEDARQKLELLEAELSADERAVTDLDIAIRALEGMEEKQPEAPKAEGDRD
jgi:hypothetical protein